MPLRAVPLEQRFWKYVNKTNTCWLWRAGVTGSGYPVIHTSRGGPEPRRQLLAHRLSYELHHGPIPDGAFVCHRCDTPACVNPEHLFLGTQSENIQDCSNKNRLTGNKKLTEAEVRHIRQLKQSGIGPARIAAIIGRPRPTIKDVCAGRSWRHVY